MTIQDKLTKLEDLLQGIGLATNALLTIESLDRAIKQALDFLGQATKVDRIYVFQNDRCPVSDKAIMSQR